MIATVAPESLPYYYGPITRENAELILFDRGCMDGMYLLRASHSPTDDAGNSTAGYVLSLCRSQQVVHYRIVRDAGDGLYHMPGMAHDKYAGPVELIQGCADFAGFLNIPCLKPLDVFMPGVNCSVSEDRLKDALRKKASEWGIEVDRNFESLLDDRQSEFWRLVLKTFHECEPWFHGRISREESEARLIRSGLTDGKFLVRERDPCSFTLSLGHDSQIKHYKIDVLSTGEVGIQDGPRFGNIISLVSHYSVFSDGLWCQLQQPCVHANQESPVVDAIEPVPSNAEQTESPTVVVKSIYPVLPNLESPSDGETSNGGDREVISVAPNKVTGNHKSKSTWFINHLPKLSKDKSAKVATKVSNALDLKFKNPKAKKLTPLDISPPVIARPAPPPPLPPVSVLTSPSECNGDTSSVNPDAVAENGLIPSTEPIGTRTLTGSPKLNASTPVPLRGMLDGPKQKKPLPAPRHRRGQPLLTEPLSIDTVPPSPLATPSTPCTPSALQESSRRISGVVFKYPPTATVESPVLDEPKVDDELPVEEPKRFPWMKSNNSVDSNMVSVIQELKGRTTLPPISPLPPEATNKMPCSNETPQYEEIDPEFNEPNDSDASAAPLQVESLLIPEVENEEWENVADDGGRTSEDDEHQKPPLSNEESESHFKTLRNYRKGPTAIDRKNIVLQEKIGLGNFGDVMKAVFKSGPVEVPCAIKTLRREAISSGKEDILREARIMTKLDHAHIVRLFGVSEGDPFYLVMELAPLGPLNAYVRHNKDVEPRDILLLMYQVAMGMEYLESMQFVHRDLAARNVLLVNDSFAKISDFGMSRALGLHTDYYRVEPQAKLPLKWYAPECIYYFRFSCKSDVWSYGITMWEALSYGERPYQGLTGREILAMFSTDRRLKRPEKCSQEMYAIMWQCWQLNPEDRPTFAKLTSILKDKLNI